jgi:hypothetical protein
MLSNEYYYMTVAKQKMADAAAEASRERLAREGRGRTRRDRSWTPELGVLHRIRGFVTGHGWLARQETKPSPTRA